MSKKKVMVLGCGPAGLLCAHAAKLSGHDVHVISEKKRSFIAGAQYLHSHIPEMTDPRPDGYLKIERMGSEKVYAEKVYGNPEASTSWRLYDQSVHEVWNLRTIYEKLWEQYQNIITDGFIFPRLMDIASAEADAIFSTVPLSSLFPHATFHSRLVWIKQYDFDKDNLPEMTIRYNGTNNVPWYRASSIFGYVSYEYGSERNGAIRITKPLSAEIDNPWPKLHLFGRYGQWKKGVLVDDAFREATEVSRALHEL